ncbi:DUF4249 domain-containing protein [Dysgonomonas sp. 511]|uniref:DUF4249 domain-containing protein n=1 Tax=Dysgonomonas sp. 511 TaxID=2302930 RepID=UPI0013D812F4|nr:DUF4249 domain-containing protein [Dysgonomonas sp. 511]NDV80277.1 DUF4249 domain-containing protein [Dysgonomonas sp. 511]
MKPIYTLLTIIAIAFSACEKQMILDIDTAEPRDVISAIISEEVPCVVVLTKTQGFYDNNPYQTISGATVTLSDSKGKTETLNESFEPGVYTSKMTGEVGETYYLKIEIEDNVYEAEAKVPAKVPIEELYIYQIQVGDGSWFSPCVAFNDPAEEENYYYFLLTINDRMMRSFYLEKDENRNGKPIDKILYFNKEDNFDDDLETGDHIYVEMQTIDKGAYTYFYSLSSAAGRGATNPLTNFTGGALGCFKAYNSTYADAYVSWDIVRPAK